MDQWGGATIYIYMYIYVIERISKICRSMGIWTFWVGYVYSMNHTSGGLQRLTVPEGPCAQGLAQTEDVPGKDVWKQSY